MSSVPRSHRMDTFGPTRNRDGCFTCRIRKKRCDGAVDDAGQSCGECARLSIPCLGWGEKRPEWCRDKAALTEFKKSIKKQLSSRSASRPTLGPRIPSRIGSSIASSRVVGSEARSIHDHSSPTNMFGLLSDSRHAVSASHSTFASHSADRQLASKLVQFALASGVPAQFMQFIMNIDELAQWKTSEIEQGRLSLRELARRGRAIEDVLHGERSPTFRPEFDDAAWLGAYGDMLGESQGNMTPLSDISWSESNSNDLSQQASAHPAGYDQHSMLFGTGIPGPASGSPVAFTTTMDAPHMSAAFASQGMHLPVNSGAYSVGVAHHLGFGTHGGPLSVVSSPPQDGLTVPTTARDLIFKEACLLFLYTIISGPNPKIEEIETTVGNLQTRLNALPFSEQHADLVFPACIATCLSRPEERELAYSTVLRVALPDVQLLAQTLIQEFTTRQQDH